jgi:hypothetical protein
MILLGSVLMSLEFQFSEWDFGFEVHSQITQVGGEVKASRNGGSGNG